MAEKKKKFEELLAQLEETIEKLERGDLGLDDAMAEFEKGMKLLKACNDVLAAAEKKIQILTGIEGNEPQTADFNPEQEA